MPPADLKPSANERATTDPTTIDGWCELVTTTHAAMRASLSEAGGRIVDLARALYGLKQSCEKKQGGSEFSNRVRELTGMSQSLASKFCVIGEHAEKLISAGISLPPSINTLYAITELPAEVIERDITPETTPADVRRLKAKLLPKAAPPSLPPKQKEAQRTTTDSAPKAAKKGKWIHRNQVAAQAFEREAFAQISAEVKALPEAQRESIVQCVAGIVGMFSALVDIGVEDIKRIEGNSPDPASTIERKQAETMAEVATLPEKSRDRFNRLYEQARAALEADFAMRVNDAVNKIVDARTESRKEYYVKNLKQVNQERKQLLEREKLIRDPFTQEEAKFLLQLLHPDRAPVGLEEKFQRAFQTINNVINHLQRLHLERNG